MGNTVSTTITSIPPSSSYPFTAFARGGAIYADWNSTISLSGNGSVTFMGNTVSTTFTTITSTTSYRIGALAYGGAICALPGSDLTLNNNGRVVFEGNTASSSCSSFAEGWTMGGAIYGYHSTITLSNNGSVIFSKNSVTSTAADGYAYGGAIYDYFGCITLSNNGNVTFIGNTACSCANSDFSVDGGAISCDMIEVNYNNSVTFSGNTATVVDAFSTSVGDADAGAIHGIYISFSNNGTVSFSGNKVEYMAYGTSEYRGGDTIGVENFGGAITASSTDSDSKALGGAIYVGLNLDIHNNNSVLFEKNAEVTNGEYRLRSIYVAGGNDGKVSLSAAAGKSITFRDSIYIGYDSTVSLNANYTDAEGNVHKQQGDIIFTGATTEDDLYSVKGNVAGTEKEILASRTSVVQSVTNLYGGRLRVEDGAIYQGQGIIAHEGSAATVLVKDSTLNHAGYSFTFRRGTTLNIVGRSSISGNLVMEENSTLAVTVGAQNTDTAALTLSGSLTMKGGINLKLTSAGNLDRDQSYKLLTGTKKPDNWSSSTVSLMADSGMSVSFDDLAWEEDTLWLYYVASFEPLPEPEPMPEPMPEPEFLPELNHNQQIVFDTIKDIMGGGTPDGLLGELGKEVTGTRDEEKLKELLDSLGGAEYATLMSSQQDAARGHMRRLRNSLGNGWALMGTRSRAHIEIYHNRMDVDGDSRGRGYELNETGGQFSVEFIQDEKTSGGFALASGRSRLQPDGGMTQHSDNTYVDAFLMHRDGSYTARTSLGVGVHSYELDRNVMGNAVSAETEGSSVNFMHESAYAMALDESNSVQVFGAVESSLGKLGAFHEKGADTASLQVKSQDAWMTTLSAGARYMHHFAVVKNAPSATLSLQAGVEASLGDTDSEVEVNFSGARRNGFKQSGTRRDTFGYNLGASLHVPVSARSAVYASGDAVLRGDSSEVNANVGVQLAF